MNFFVNIEISTSKIVGIVANRSEEDVVTILASETLTTEGCIKRGSIYNIEATAGKIKRLLNLLENNIGTKISFCYITLNPKGLKGIRHSETKLINNSIMTLEMEEELKLKIKQYRADTDVNYSTTNISYILDGSIIDSPIGKQGVQLTADCSILIGPPAIGKVTKEVITNKNNLKIHNFIWSPIAQASLLLTTDNLQNGCMLLDLGAGTTTATIYKDNILKYMVSVPMGSNLITKDIMSLGFDLTSAEHYKREFVNVDPTNKEVKNISEKLNTKELNKIVKLRVDEILLNVQARLNESEVFHKLDDGIFTTGGGSLLVGITEYIESLFKMPTQKAKPSRLFINNIGGKLNSPEYFQILGSLLFARKNCQYVRPVVEPKPVETEVKEEIKQVAPEPERKEKEKKDKKGIFNKIGDLFSNGTFYEGD